MELDRALELILQKERKNMPLRELGVHPETGEPIAVFNGRYGPYVKHVKTNASLPKGKEVDEVTLEEALELIKAKEKAGPRKKTAKKKNGKEKRPPRRRLKKLQPKRRLLPEKKLPRKSPVQKSLVSSPGVEYQVPGSGSPGPTEAR